MLNDTTVTPPALSFKLATLDPQAWVISKMLITLEPHGIFGVKKKAKIRNQYNLIPHLTHDTVWESDKHHIQESKEVSPFPAGGNMAERNRPDSMTDKHKTPITKNDPQQKQRNGQKQSKALPTEPLCSTQLPYITPAPTCALTFIYNNQNAMYILCFQFQCISFEFHTVNTKYAVTIF